MSTYYSSDPDGKDIFIPNVTGVNPNGAENT